MLSKKNQRVLDANERGYKVHSDGCVTSCHGTVLSLRESSRGYLEFSVSGSRYPVTVHKLAAYQQYGEAIFENGIEVRHLNSIRTDNTAVNLAIGTRSANKMDMLAKRRQALANHAASFVRKLLPNEVKEMRALKEKGWTHRELMERFCVSKSTVSYCVNRKTYKNV